MRPDICQHPTTRHKMLQNPSCAWGGYICCRSQRRSEQPLFPFGSGNAFDLGGAERVKAVHEGNSDVDFGGLAVRVT